MQQVRRIARMAVPLVVFVGLWAGPVWCSEIIDSSAVVENVYPGPGGDTVVQLEWGARNLTQDRTVSVLIDAYVVYSNGLRQQVFPPQVAELGRDGAMIYLGFVIVPDRAAPGTATFEVSARILRVEGERGGSGESDTDSDVFQVP